MNRVIKFRAWDGEKMRYWDPRTASTGFQLYDDETWKVTQFTNLSDRNGKEIYEGDIVKVRGVFVREVGYKEDRFCVLLGDSHLVWDKQTRVVGNIYENSELLKV